MSNSPDAIAPELNRAALDFLKGKGNPFESLARPQRLDDQFLDVHVPELLAPQRDLVCRIIDRYRIDDYTRSADLPPTRAVIVLGDRGAGKTHLLQSLSYRPDRKSQIIVRPSYYDGNQAFEEYLLTQLVATLLAADEVYGTRPIDDIAAALTHRLLARTLGTLGPTERIFAQGPSRWRRWSLLLGGGRRYVQKFDDLKAALENASPGSDVPQLVKRHGFTPEVCLRLIRGHLARFETGHDLAAALRRDLYGAMARAVLLEDREPLIRLLEGGFTESEGGAHPRHEIVGRMLHVASEACVLVRQPIVFAFDNLERLFSPQNRFDEELARFFWSTLAQAIDNTRGLLLLLFAETGMFEKVGKYMDSFARDRIMQGVPIYAQGPVHEVRLLPPSADEMRALVAERVKRALVGFARADELPPLFPFDEAFLRQEATGTQNLRITLVRLRDEYSRRVYAQAASVAVNGDDRPAVAWDNIFESAWKDQLAVAARLLNESPAGQLATLHAGLGQLLQAVSPSAQDGWVLDLVQPTATIGDNPKYGIVTLLTWKRAGAKNGSALTLGIGFLLARGTGMRLDLAAKLDFFRRPAKGEQLVVFCLSDNKSDDIVDQLPAATRKVWDESRYKKKTHLRRVDQGDLRPLLAIPAWLNSLAEQAPPPDRMGAFLKDRLTAWFALVAPPVEEEGKVHADEN